MCVWGGGEGECSSPILDPSPLLQNSVSALRLHLFRLYFFDVADVQPFRMKYSIAGLIAKER